MLCMLCQLPAIRLNRSGHHVSQKASSPAEVQQVHDAELSQQQAVHAQILSDVGEKHARQMDAERSAHAEQIAALQAQVVKAEVCGLLHTWTGVS